MAVGQARWSKDTRQLQPLQDRIADFMAVYDKFVEGSGGNKCAAFGPGRVVLIVVDGEHKNLRAGVQPHMQNLEGVAATVQSMVTVEGPTLFDSLQPKGVPSRLLQLFTSKFAPNVGEYYCKRAQGDFKSLIEGCQTACAAQEKSWSDWCGRVWQVPAHHLEEVAAEMVLQPVIGPGPQNLLDNCLVKRGDANLTGQLYYADALTSVRDIVLARLRAPQTGVDRFATQIFEKSCMKFLDPFDFQCFGCTAHEACATGQLSKPPPLSARRPTTNVGLRACSRRGLSFNLR